MIIHLCIFNRDNSTIFSITEKENENMKGTEEMKNFFKLRTNLYSVLIVAMILSSASFTISAIQQDDTASGIT